MISREHDAYAASMSTSPAPRAGDRTLADIVFVGCNSRIAALDRYTGELLWKWKAPKGSGFVSMLLDGDRLIVSVSGYTYCLEPLFGQQVWFNPLKGFGWGTANLVSLNAAGSTATGLAAAAEAARQAAAAAAAASG